MSGRVSELSRLSGRAEEMVSRGVSEMSGIGKLVVSSCLLLFCFGSFLIGLV